jgi:hypothetical protein
MRIRKQARHMRRTAPEAGGASTARARFVGGTTIKRTDKEIAYMWHPTSISLQ